jgi:hypothetical protein
MPARPNRSIIHCNVRSDIKAKAEAMAASESRSLTNWLEVPIERAFEEANRTNRADNLESGPRRPV